MLLRVNRDAFLKRRAPLRVLEFLSIPLKDVILLVLRSFLVTKTCSSGPFSRKAKTAVAKLMTLGSVTP
jgi:hypothetical protein